MGNINEHDFLENWKKIAAYAIYDGVPDIINMPDRSIEDVTDKNQLSPNVDALLNKIGRASCRERVCLYV